MAIQYSIILWGKRRLGDAYWFNDALLFHPPLEVLEMMCDEFVRVELGLCAVCTDHCFRCHVMVEQMGKLCPILFHDAVKPEWKLEDVV